MRNLVAAAVVVVALAAVGWRSLAGGGEASGTVSHHAVEPPSGAQNSTASGLPQGHVYAGIVEEPDDINPFTAAGAVAKRFVLAFTHDALLDLDPATGELRPALARAFRLDDDGMGCTFELREGVTFADGTPLTMADVLFGYELHRAGKLPMGAMADAFARVASAEATDAGHLHVRFTDAHYAAVRVVGENWLVASKQHFVAAVASRAGRSLDPASAEFAAQLAAIKDDCGPGSGPYRFAAENWQRRTQLQLVRNDRSWRRAAQPGTWNLDGVRLLFRSGPAGLAAMLQREVDWQMVADPDAELQARPELQEHWRVLAYDHPGLGVFRAVFQCRRGPCADVAVRRAVARLFDREALAKRFAGMGGIAEAFAKPGSPAYPKHVAEPFDLAAARAALRDLGFDPAAGRPLRLTLVAPQGSPVIDAALAGFQQAARDAGIELTVRQLDFRGYVAERARGEWDLELALQSFRPWGDPYDFVHSQGADNAGGFADPECDRLAAAARTTQDRGQREALWRQLHERVAEQKAAVFLLHPLARLLLNRDLQGAEPGPLGLSPERMWVEKGRQRR
ncbi:MAG: hypothetical protein RL398_160 [Planctomycetota bacterium]